MNCLELQVGILDIKKNNNTFINYVLQYRRHIFCSSFARSFETVATKFEQVILPSLLF